MPTQTAGIRSPQPMPMLVSSVAPASAASLSLSVLVPVYNERHLVGASLARLLSLTHPAIKALEVIVVDDRSTDGSWEVLEAIASADPRIRLIRHDRISGKGAAVRTALGHARHDVCLVH